MHYLLLKKRVLVSSLKMNLHRTTEGYFLHHIIKKFSLNHFHFKLNEKHKLLPTKESS